MKSKARTVFANSHTGIVGLNPTRGMDAFMYLFYFVSVEADGGLIPNLSTTDCE
jgi:hypothetical protein